MFQSLSHGFPSKITYTNFHIINIIISSYKFNIITNHLWKKSVNILPLYHKGEEMLMLYLKFSLVKVPLLPFHFNCEPQKLYF